MFNQLVKNVASASTIVPDLSSVIDGSFKLRLRNMSLRKACDRKTVVVYDNQIIFRMHSLFNFPRIKYADQIGVNYWASAKYDPNRTMAPVSFYTLLDGSVKPLHHQAAVLDGHLEAPQTAWGQEIDNLTTFVSTTVKRKIVSQYVTLPNGTVKEVSHFPKTFDFEMPEESAWQIENNSQGIVEIQDVIETVFQAKEIEAEWTQIVEKEVSIRKPKKSRNKRITATKTSNVIKTRSAELVQVPNAQSRRNRKKVNTVQKILVNA